jgi:hypothetical protein
MNPSPLEARFDTFREYRQVISDLIPLARRELVIFDPDLKQTGLESPGGVESLARFLSAGRDNRMRVVLHDPDHVERYCPRWMSLLRLYGHSISVRQSPEDLRQLTDCFMVADKRHAVIRFHSAYARGKFLLEQREDVDDWQRRFDELWEVSLPARSATTLGL